MRGRDWHALGQCGGRERVSQVVEGRALEEANYAASKPGLALGAFIRSQRELAQLSPRQLAEMTARA
jgi:hypothetical protein